MALECVNCQHPIHEGPCQQIELLGCICACDEPEIEWGYNFNESDEEEMGK